MNNQRIVASQAARMPPIWLLIGLIALPQVAETVLAPSLPNLAVSWHLSPAQTQWTTSIFFLGFAVGVFLWGRISDSLGRRPAMLGGLTVGLIGTLAATCASSFELILAGQFVQALGLGTCSITTQTVLRDCLQGTALTRAFATVGMVLAWSPAVGPLAGQLLSDHAGYRAVFWLIAAMVALLSLATWRGLHETRGVSARSMSTRRLAVRMLMDAPLLRAAVLVAGLNALVFSFYAAGPFMVGELPVLGFGWAGLGVAIAGSAGAALNRRLNAELSAPSRVRYALASVLAGVLLQLVLVLATHQGGVLWAAAALPIFFGFGLAIPNILGPALRNYADCLGRAGALFGVIYYALLGAMLALTSTLRLDDPLPLVAFWLVVAIALLIAQGRLPGRDDLDPAPAN